MVQLLVLKICVQDTVEDRIDTSLFLPSLVSLQIAACRESPSCSVAGSEGYGRTANGPAATNGGPAAAQPQKVVRYSTIGRQRLSSPNGSR